MPQLTAKRQTPPPRIRSTSSFRWSRSRMASCCLLRWCRTTPLPLNCTGSLHRLRRHNLPLHTQCRLRSRRLRRLPGSFRPSLPNWSRRSSPSEGGAAGLASPWRVSRTSREARWRQHSENASHNPTNCPRHQASLSRAVLGSKDNRLWKGEGKLKRNFENLCEIRRSLNL